MAKLSEARQAIITKIKAEKVAKRKAKKAKAKIKKAKVSA